MSINYDKSVAVVGAGSWGKNLVRNFHALGALNMVCESDDFQRATIAEDFPDVCLTESLDEVLGDPTVLAVAIATPAIQHAELVERSLLAGKDVYVEKPLCLSESEGQSLNTLARQRGKLLMVGHLLWYHPCVLKLKSIMSDGELGRVRYIYSNRLNMGKLRREENVLWSFAPHDVSVILSLLGELPESVQAQGGNFLHNEIADTTVSLLNFASGVRAHIFVSWLHPFKEQKLVVVGDKQMAVFDDTAPWPEKLQLYPHSVSWNGNVPVAKKAERRLVEVEEAEPLRNECVHFLDCIRTRTTPRTDGEEGLRVLRVLNACQRALETTSKIGVGESFGYYAHSTSVIDDGAVVGDGTKIWHFSHLLRNTRIGENCNIGQNVVIGPNVTVGNGCKIQNNVSIYDGVTLGNDVFCGPSMVFTNVVNPRAQVSRKSQYQATLVGDGATLGANCTIVCGRRIGKFSFVGAGAVVTKDVPEYALVVGNPARQVGWMCECGEKLSDKLTCASCDRVYEHIDERLHRIS